MSRELVRMLRGGQRPAAVVRTRAGRPGSRFGGFPQRERMPLSRDGGGAIHGEREGIRCRPPELLAFGRTPDQVPSEVIPHIQHGVRIAPDACGPAVWV